MPEQRALKRFQARIRESCRLASLAMRLTWRASPRLVLNILLLLLLQAFFTPLQLILSKAVINRAADDLGFSSAHDAVAAQFPLGVWIALAAVSLAVGQLIQPFVSSFQSLAGDRLTGYVTEQLILAANRWQGLERFEDPIFADDLQRARDRAGRGSLDLLIFMARAGVSLFTAATLALVLLGLHPLVALVLVVATVPQMALYWEYRNRTGKHLYMQTPETRRLQYSRDQLLTPESAKDIRLYEMGAFFREHYETTFEQTMGTLDRLRHRLMVPVALASIVAAVASAAVYIGLVWFVAHGQRTIGDLVLYGGAATMLQANLLTLGFDLGFLPLALSFLPSLFRVLEAPPDLPRAPRPRPIPRPIRQGIVFEHVTFIYPGRCTPILRDVTLHLPANECVALVGHNGAGKTTIVKLLLRLYDPSSGRILLDGVDLREYDLDALRREMGAIFQDYVRYELTVGENIGVGQVEAFHDRDRLLHAAGQARISELIERLPDGLDTQVGREFGGRELSGGEWQKLALARAFMRDCQILMLDEPTAALDIQTEFEVYTRFHDLTRGRTTLLISHRFSTIRMADRIFFLADGQIQEEGNHTELMTRNGEYARLYRLQAMQYLGHASAGG